MSAALFKHCSVEYGGKPARGVEIKCGSCGGAERIPVNSFRTTVGNDDGIFIQHVSRKVEQRGWRVGKNINSHTCPRCLRAAGEEAARKVTSMTEKLSIVKPAPIKADALPHSAVASVRTMDTDDRRLIFAKLNEVYLSAAAGYSAGWSDEKVSNDLGVPRDWVRQVREDFFGTIENAAEYLAESAKEVEAGLAQIKNLLKQATDLCAKAMDLRSGIAPVERLAEKLDRDLADLKAQLK